MRQQTRFHQLWHLPLGTNVTVSGQTAYTNFSRGNVLIQQLLGDAHFDVVRGATNPTQGWLPTTWQPRPRTGARGCAQHQPHQARHAARPFASDGRRRSRMPTRTASIFRSTSAWTGNVSTSRGWHQRRVTDQ